MHEGTDEVETVSCSKRDDNVAECGIGLDQATGQSDTLAEQRAGISHWGKSFQPCKVWGTARKTVYPAHQRVMQAQRPNRNMHVAYVHFEP